MRCRWEQADGAEAGSLKDPGRGWGGWRPCPGERRGCAPTLGSDLLFRFHSTPHRFHSKRTKQPRGNKVLRLSLNALLTLWPPLRFSGGTVRFPPQESGSHRRLQIRGATGSVCLCKRSVFSPEPHLFWVQDDWQLGAGPNRSVSARRCARVTWEGGGGDREPQSHWSPL